MSRHCSPFFTRRRLSDCIEWAKEHRAAICDLALYHLDEDGRGAVIVMCDTPEPRIEWMPRSVVLRNLEPWRTEEGFLLETKEYDPDFEVVVHVFLTLSQQATLRLELSEPDRKERIA